MSPSASTSGWPGEAEVGLDRDPPGPVDVEARLVCELRRQAGGGDARGPDRRARGDLLDRRRRGSRIATESASTSTTVCPTSGVTPSFSSERAAFCESGSGKPARTRSAASTSSTRAVRVSAERKSRRSASCASSAIWPGHLDAGRARRRRRRRSASAGDAQGRVRALRPRTPRGCGCGSRARPTSDFSSGACVLPLVVAEVGVPRAAGDDRACRSASAPARSPFGRCSRTTSRRSRSKPVTSASSDARVPLALQHRAQRRRDLGRRRRAGRDLVDERLEEHVVLPVDQGHLDRCAAQSAHRLQAREAAADDDHPMRRSRVHAATASSSACSSSASAATKSRSRISDERDDGRRERDDRARPAGSCSGRRRARSGRSLRRGREAVPASMAIACGAPPVEISVRDRVRVTGRAAVPLRRVDHRRAHLGGEDRAEPGDTGRDADLAERRVDARGHARPRRLDDADRGRDRAACSRGRRRCRRRSSRRAGASSRSSA